MALRAALLVLALLAGLAPAGAQERVHEHANLARPNTPVPPDLYPIASDARLGGDGQRTRLVVDLSRTIDVAAFTLADPYRVVIDLPQVTFQLPARTGENGRGLIKAFRYGLVMQGGSRLVVDAAGPVRIDKAFVRALCSISSRSTGRASCAISRSRQGRAARRRRSRPRSSSGAMTAAR
jgi:N-acetylmuramoyl-L-alanine amidase